MEEIKMPSKKFKIKIRVEAGYFDGEAPVDAMTFEQAANDWFQNQGGLQSLLNYFTENKKIKEHSYLQYFTFEQSVDKEAY